MTFEITPGTIYSAYFSFADSKQQQKRPVLALSAADEFGSLRVVFVTKAEAENGLGFLLEAADFVGAALKHQAYVRWDDVCNLDVSRIEKPVAQLSDKAYERVLRGLITKGIPELAAFKYRPQKFQPGHSVIPPSGKVLGENELTYMVEASLDGWLTTGRFNDAFEKGLAAFLGVKHVLTTNSGSSANLLALAALTSPKLGDKALKPGDEMITVAAGFPTTLNPALQYGLVPVFVDVNIPTYNVDPRQIEAAISDKTRVIMLAHTLGNPFDLDEVMRIARQYDLWVIEDCCDALGSTYTTASGETKLVGSFGHIGTLSFYPAHHITMGEGGAVFTQNGVLKRIIESFRDWGRDCYCDPGKDNTCRKRFDYQLGDLPYGYDHKYTYSHLGYNLKISDMQAAVGLAQLERLPDFIRARQRNFQQLYQGLVGLGDFLILPEATPQTQPSWFGFPLTLKQPKRREFIAFLDQRKIGTRLLFAGNLTRQPYFAGRPHRLAGELTVTDQVMNDTLWIGCYPGLNSEMIDYMIASITEFFTGQP